MRDTEYCINNKAPYFEEIERRLGEEMAESIKAECRYSLDGFFEKHGHFEEAKAIHAEENILPIGYIYLALKKRIGSEAYGLVRDVMRNNCLRTRDALNREIEEKGTAQFFADWEKGCRESFGKENGYTCDFHKAGENGVSLEVYHCLYYEMLTEMGCPEVTRIFCDSDDFEMGDLEKVVFRRNGTLAYGNSMCDFKLMTRE